MNLDGDPTANRTMFANNWDRLGGRALDILNGYVLSIRLKCDFVFYWPFDERFPEMEEQLSFFNYDFIQQHRVYYDPQDLNYEFVDFSQFTQESAKTYINDRSETKYFKNTNFFASPKFLGESELEISDFYIKCAIESLSRESLELWAQARRFYGNFESIHGRYGDLLEGNFNQYVDPRKYVDTLSLAALVRKLNSKTSSLTLLSDTPEITIGIENQEICDLRPIIHLSALNTELNEFEVQCFELFIMASSRTIYASSLSAFSILASKIGGNNLILIHSVVEENILVKINRKSLRRHYSKFNHRIRKQTKARDLVSLLQKDWKHLQIEELTSIVKIAQKSDSNYVLALCLSAIIDAIESKFLSSNYKMDIAEIESRGRLNIHDDPLMLTLTTKLCLLGEKFPIERLEIRAEIEKLSPFQFSKNSALDFLDSYLDFQVEATESEKHRHLENKARIEGLWQKIVISDEKELLFALLKLLKLVGFKR